jgi:hypothetical protein
MDAMLIMKRDPRRAASGAIAAEWNTALRFPLQHGAGTVSEDRYNPSSKGWGFAALIVALAIIANVTAWSIHKATYLKPDKANTPAEQGR